MKYLEIIIGILFAFLIGTIILKTFWFLFILSLGLSTISVIYLWLKFK